MAFWNRKKPVYDRTRILEAAEQARSRGRTKKALAEYRKILAVDPKDPQVNARVAPLLVKAKLPREAAAAFEVSASSFVEKGFVDKALAVYSQAAAHFPLDDGLWVRIADLTVERGRKADGVKALLSGAEHLRRKRSHRPKAVNLLERALIFEPSHVEATLALSRLLAKEGRKKEALSRLEVLARQFSGPTRKRIRGAQLRLSPTPAAFWRWLRGK